MTIDRYFRKYEAQVPNMETYVWKDQDLVGTQSFKGRSFDVHLYEIPFEVSDDSEKRETTSIQIAKEGPGRLYYRVAAQYAIKDTGNIKPADYGFKVERSYEAVDDPADVVYEPTSGVVKVKAGSRVKVTLQLTNDITRFNDLFVKYLLFVIRFHVALVDKLPAGFEVLNPALKGTSIPKTEEDTKNEVDFGCMWYWFFNRNWYVHENLRDERVDVFATYLQSGTHKYSYYARATGIGKKFSIEYVLKLF